MSDSILKDNTTTDDLVHDLALISLKIAQFTSRIEVWLGDEFLPPKYRLELYEMYQIANRHFKSDDPDAGKLYTDKEVAELKKPKVIE
jgi:hypothetical protein